MVNKSKGIKNNGGVAVSNKQTNYLISQCALSLSLPLKPSISNASLRLLVSCIFTFSSQQSQVQPASHYRNHASQHLTYIWASFLHVTLRVVVSCICYPHHHHNYGSQQASQFLTCDSQDGRILHLTLPWGAVCRSTNKQSTLVLQCGGDDNANVDKKGWRW